jgi:hypothetical protein
VNNIYIVEGECEEKLLKNLQNYKYGYIDSGKIFIINLMQEKLTERSAVFSKKNDAIACIIDTDICEKANIEAFKHNYKLLHKKAKKLKIFVQNKNLEDELAKALKITKNELYEVFNAQGKKEFKNRFNDITNLIQKLETKSIDYTLLWNSFGEFRALLGDGYEATLYYSGKELIKVPKKTR